MSAKRIKYIDLIVGARPNFVKVAKLYKILKKSNFRPFLIHTGQHYSNEMSDVFFSDLKIPLPDIDLNVGSHSHAVQTSLIMQKYENILIGRKVDMVMVFGDVNSTVATALTAKKLHISVAHVEAGLRSFDRRMPEEINRLATDAISDYLFAPSEDAVKNLLIEGKNPSSIFLAGNIMIDTLLENIDRIKSYDICSKFNVRNKKYYYVTIHRPSNVDSKEMMKKTVNFLNSISNDCCIIFPMHPRTLKMLDYFKLTHKFSKYIRILSPQSYLTSISLEMHSKAVITDSGGIQEETTLLNVPCFTLRDSTERPITITEGTNKGMSFDSEGSHKVNTVNSAIRTAMFI